VNPVAIGQNQVAIEQTYAEIRQNQAAIEQNQVAIRQNAVGIIGKESWLVILGPLFLVLATVSLFVALKVELLLYHTRLLFCSAAFVICEKVKCCSETASGCMFVNKCVIKIV